MDEHSPELLGLNSVLAGEPSPLAFRRACALLEALPEGEGRADAFARAAATLSAWPEEARAVARPWWLAHAAGARKETWGLVAGLAPVGSPEDEVPDDFDEPLRTFFDDPAFASLGTLDLSFGVGPDAIRALANATGLGALHSLDLNADDPDGASLAELARSPILGRLRSLDLSGVGGAGVEALILGGGLTNLVHLGLTALDCDLPRLVDLLGRGGCERLRSLSLSLDVDPAGVAALGRWSGAARLERLELGMIDVDFDAIVPPLATSPGFGSLVAFRLGPPVAPGQSLSAAGVERLVSAPFFGHLKQVAIKSHAILDRGAIALAAALPPGIELLELPGAGIGPEGAMALAARTDLANLSEINLRGNAVGDAGVAALAGSGLLRGCRRLDLQSNGIGPAGVAALAASAAAGGLEDLDLSRNPIGDKGATALRSAPFAAGLRRLELGGCDLGTAGAKAIARPGLFGRLEWLGLGGNVKLGNAGVVALCGAGNFGRLMGLDLSFTGTGVAGVKALAGSGLLAQLVTLELQGCNLSAPAIRGLASSPNARLLEVLALDVTDRPKLLRSLATAADLRPEVRAEYALLERSMADDGEEGVDPVLRLVPAALRGLWESPGNDRVHNRYSEARRDLPREIKDQIEDKFCDLFHRTCRGTEISPEEMEEFVEAFAVFPGIGPIFREAQARWLEARGKII